MAKKTTYEELEQRVKELEKEVAKGKSTEEEFKRERNIFLGGPVVVFKWAAKENWPVDYVSPNVTQFGYQAEDFMNGRILYIDIIHPEDREKIVSYVQEYSESGVAFYEQEYRIIHADGEIKWVYDFTVIGRNDKNEITHYDGYILDNTERKQTEEALRESEEKYRTLFNNAGDAIVIRDHEGHFLEVNQITCDRYGYSREELLKMTPMDLDTPEYAEKVTERTKQIIRKGHVIFETVHVSKDGKEIPVELSSRIIKYKGRSAIMTIVRDVTERKRAEEEKKRLQAQFQHAQRMESIGTLAGGIAHNFNNLLMSIIGNASIMLFNIDSSHPHYQNLKNIEKNVQSGSKLTRQLLGYAREGRYDVKPTSLNQLVKETSVTFDEARKEIVVHQELADKLYGIEADQGQIEQVLLNFYVNAADAMPKGGDLFLKTMNVTHKDMKGKPYEPKPGKYVLLTIRDTGVGIDKNTMERIFDPFFTTKGLAQGTGLGLASAYGIIKAHGGYIDVESEKGHVRPPRLSTAERNDCGHGTTFSIYLPATDKEVEEEKELTGELVEGEEIVLLVDDEEMVLDAGEKMLKKLGYEVLLAGSGQEALELYEKNQDRIDMVLLDMVMPGVGGGETYDRMKEINPNVKVLLSSGYSIDGEAKEILKRGCDAFIQKPFYMEQLSQSIREILDKV